MRNIRRLSVLAAMPVVALAVGASAFAAKPPDAARVSVCHQTGNGQFVEIMVSGRALQAHAGHGDILLGDYGYCP